MTINRRTFFKLTAAAAASIGVATYLPASMQTPMRVVEDKDDGDLIPCDGRPLSRAMYPELFAAIGTIYGGDVKRFNIPDMRGHFARMNASEKVPALEFQFLIRARKTAATERYSMPIGMIISATLPT